MLTRLLALFILGIGLSACVPQAENKTITQADNETKPIITTTTGMIADAVSQLVGEQATVYALMGPGTDPHLYKATQGDLEKLQSADIIVYNGLHLEGKMTEVLKKLAAKKPVYAIADAIDKDSLLNSSGYADAYDPHIWFDVQLWKLSVNGLAGFLNESLPNLQAELQKNAKQYTHILDSLDKVVKTQIQRIPSEQRIMITAHDAFAYFGRAYDVEVRGLQGISTASELGMADRVALTNFIVENRIKAVFVESSVPEKALRAVVEGAQSKGHTVSIGGTLYSDALGPPESGASNYVDMVHHNVHTLVEALK